MKDEKIIEKARKGFEEDFAKKNYMEEHTGDYEHLEKIINNLNILTQSKTLIILI